MTTSTIAPVIRADVIVTCYGTPEQWQVTPSVGITPQQARSILDRHLAAGGNIPDGENTLAALYPAPGGFTTVTWRA